MIAALTSLKTVLDVAGNIQTAKQLAQKGHEKAMQAKAYYAENKDKNLSLPLIGEIGTPKQLIIKGAVVAVSVVVLRKLYKDWQFRQAANSATTDEFTRQAMDIRRKIGSWYENTDEDGIYQILKETANLQQLSKRYKQLYELDLLTDLQNRFSMAEYQKVLEIVNTKNSPNNQQTQAITAKYLLFDKETTFWTNPNYYYLFGGKLSKKAPPRSVLPFPVVSETTIDYSVVLLNISVKHISFYLVNVKDDWGKSHPIYVEKSLVKLTTAADYNVKLKQTYPNQISFTSSDFS
jgi:hypothetical protein